MGCDRRMRGARAMGSEAGGAEEAAQAGTGARTGGDVREENTMEQTLESMQAELDRTRGELEAERTLRRDAEQRCGRLEEARRILVDEVRHRRVRRSLTARRCFQAWCAGSSMTPWGWDEMPEGGKAGWARVAELANGTRAPTAEECYVAYGDGAQPGGLESEPAQVRDGWDDVATLVEAHLPAPERLVVPGLRAWEREHARVAGVALAPRLNLVTGPSGTGKTRLLDMAWRRWTKEAVEGGALKLGVYVHEDGTARSWCSHTDGRRPEPTLDDLRIGLVQALWTGDGVAPAEPAGEAWARGKAAALTIAQACGEWFREGTEDEPVEMLVLVDGLEAHLDVKRQRRVVEAWLSIGEVLGPGVRVRMVGTTHSPLVMGSVEPWFDPERDAWWRTEAAAEGRQTVIRETYVRRGTADAWLGAPGFDLHTPRGSEQAEAAIIEAKRVCREKEPSREEVAAAHAALAGSLPDVDRFWVRWISFAEKILGEGAV